MFETSLISLSKSSSAPSSLVASNAGNDGAMVNTLQLGLGWFPEQPGGLDRYYFDLLRYGPAAGMEIRGLIAGTSRAAEESAGRIRAFGRADDSMMNRWRGVRQAVAEEIAKDPPTCVASHFALYAFPVLRHLKHLPHIVHFHGPWAAECRVEGDGGLGNWIKQWIERRVYRSADRCVVLSKAFRRMLAEEYGVDEGKIRVVPGGVNADRFAILSSRAEALAQLGWPQDRPIVFCIRRLVPRMGLEALIDATATLRLRHPDALVLIAGKGRLTNELLQRINDGGLENHVRLLGFLPDEQLPLAYRAANLSVVPTESLEGFGLITLESLAAGTPVLVTPVGGLPEAVSGLSSNLVLRSTGAQAIAEGLDAALSGTLAMPSSSDCQQYVRANFDWPIIVKRIRAVYEEAIRSYQNA